ncbi:hypothetical protein [Stieleria mannarensis]|uniref:hypothetical protein n=1 Tax=Stieleria mannarensis TaxID=2755585 RepID=UPI0015FF5AA3|nr:hypothetical protein [Rhodopirellula sp. JC639]
MKAFRILLIPALTLVLGVTAHADVTDFGTWTLVEDPDHPGLSASVNAASATLSALDTAVPAGTDIGFQSVDGATPLASAAGFYFNPDADFSLAIDYDWAFSGNPTGFLGLGFGIGEDGDGMNSAGVAMGTLDGSPFLSFGGAARINDVDQTPVALGGSPFLNPASESGTLFVAYQASGGDVIVGASTTLAASAPTVSHTFAGIQNQWSGSDLMASFFLRSDSPPPTSAWSGGNADAVFTNFRVLGGNPTAIPEPSAAVGTLWLIGALACRRSRRRV